MCNKGSSYHNMYTAYLVSIDDVVEETNCNDTNTTDSDDDDNISAMIKKQQRKQIENKEEEPLPPPCYIDIVLATTNHQGERKLSLISEISIETTTNEMCSSRLVDASVSQKQSTTIQETATTLLNYVEFFLPIHLPNNKGKENNYNSKTMHPSNDDDDDVSLEEVLRPWQVTFLNDMFHLTKISHLINLYDNVKTKIIVKLMMIWLRKNNISIIVPTTNKKNTMKNSSSSSSYSSVIKAGNNPTACRIALHIWIKSCKTILLQYQQPHHQQQQPPLYGPRTETSSNGKEGLMSSSQFAFDNKGASSNRDDYYTTTWPNLSITTIK